MFLLCRENFFDILKKFCHTENREINSLHNKFGNGIRLKVIDLPTTMMELPAEQSWVFDMVNNILIEVLGTIAEQERETTRQRQAEGIASAKRKVR